MKFFSILLGVVVGVALLLWYFVPEQTEQQKSDRQNYILEMKEKRAERAQYIKERTLVKICIEGAKIYKWHDHYYTSTYDDRWPDQEVNNLAVCQ